MDRQLESRQLALQRRRLRYRERRRPETAEERKRRLQVERERRRRRQLNASSIAREGHLTRGSEQAQRQRQVGELAGDMEGRLGRERLRMRQQRMA